jgi:aromatase
MEVFEFAIRIKTDLAAVSKAFWDLDEWTKVAPHVREIEMLYADENVQVLLMHVVTKNHHDKFKSVRYKQGNTIYYFQPTPPPILNAHRGFWRFAEDEEGVSVISCHEIDVNVEGADAFLRNTGAEPQNAEDTKQKIQNLIRNNSLQTMNALRERLENEKGENYEAQENKFGIGA